MRGLLLRYALSLYCQHALRVHWERSGYTVRMHTDTPVQATPREAHQAILSHPDTMVIVDVRTLIEREAGFVSGSIHIPLDEFSARAVELARFEKVFVICRSGGRSAAACIAASRIGLTQLVNITGGMKAWEAAGLAIEKPI